MILAGPGIRRALARGIVAGALLVACSSAATAQSVDRILAEWHDWMARNGASTGGIAVARHGKVLREAATGGLEPGAPVRLASLSKAVTALCVARLVEAGPLSFDTPLGTALAGTFARVGWPADARLREATIGQLLAHRAGLASDTTRSADLANHLRRFSAQDTAFSSQVQAAVARPLAGRPGERFEYTNAAYLLLGAVIEEATGRAYESHCRDSLLTPLGIAGASLDPAHRFMSSYGGWRMPLAGYTRLYQAYAPGDGMIGPGARAWMMNPEGKAAGPGVHYGLGTFVRLAGNRPANFWHWGSWKLGLPDGFDGPISESWMTYAVRIGSADAEAVLYLQPGLERTSAQADLDGLLSRSLAALRDP